MEGRGFQGDMSIRLSHLKTAPFIQGVHIHRHPHLESLMAVQGKLLRDSARDMVVEVWVLSDLVEAIVVRRMSTAEMVRIFVES